MRCGRLADHAPDDFDVAERAAGLQGVGHVVFAAVGGIQNGGDAALGACAVGFLQLVLGDHEHRQAGIDGQGRPQSGQAAADDQHVGEEVRHLLGMKGNEIAGREHGKEKG